MDNEQKFTPGPWEIDRENFNNTQHDDKFCAIRGTFDGDTWVVAEICGDVAQLQPEANARLIAAAPELYEALADVLHDIQEAIPALQGEPPQTAMGLWASFLAGRAVLAKVSVPRATAAQ